MTLGPPDWGQPWQLVWDMVVWVGTGGGAWPEADEDRIRQLAQEWRNAGSALTEHFSAANAQAEALAHLWQGQSGGSFHKLWRYYQDEGLPQLTQTIESLATRHDDAAREIEYEKLTIIVEVGMLMLTIFAIIVLSFITFGAALSFAAGPIAATRMLVMQALRQLIAAAGRGFVRGLIKEVAFEAIQELATDVAAQLAQFAMGTRTKWDLDHSAWSLAGGALGGLLGGLTAPGFNKLRPHAPRIAVDGLHETVTDIGTETGINYARTGNLDLDLTPGGLANRVAAEGVRESVSNNVHDRLRDFANPQLPGGTEAGAGARGPGAAVGGSGLGGSSGSSSSSSSSSGGSASTGGTGNSPPRTASTSTSGPNSDSSAPIGDATVHGQTTQPAGIENVPLQHSSAAPAPAPASVAATQSTAAPTQSAPAPTQSTATSAQSNATSAQGPPAPTQSTATPTQGPPAPTQSPATPTQSPPAPAHSTAGTGNTPTSELSAGQQTPGSQPATTITTAPAAPAAGIGQGPPQGPPRRGGPPNAGDDDGGLSRSEDFEQHRGALYFSDPATVQIAQIAVRRLRTALLALTPRQDGETDEAFQRRVESAFFRSDRPADPGQVGDGVTVDQLLEHGNLRELMTAFYNAAYYHHAHPGTLSQALVRIMDEDRIDEVEAAGIDRATVTAMRRQLDEGWRRLLRITMGRIDTRLTGDRFRFARDPFGTGNVIMLFRNASRNLVEAIRSQRNKLPHLLTRLTTPAEARAMGTGLGQFENAHLRQWRQHDRGADLTDDTPLPWEQGFMDDPANDWVDQARRQGFPAVTGISLTTTRVLLAGTFLEMSQAELERFLGALMGWMLPHQHHSMLEIAMGARIIGVGAASLDDPDSLYRGLPPLGQPLLSEGDDNDGDGGLAPTGGNDPSPSPQDDSGARQSAAIRQALNPMRSLSELANGVLAGDPVATSQFLRRWGGWADTHWRLATSGAFDGRTRERLSQTLIAHRNRLIETATAGLDVTVDETDGVVVIETIGPDAGRHAAHIEQTLKPELGVEVVVDRNRIDLARELIPADGAFQAQLARTIDLLQWARQLRAAAPSQKDTFLATLPVEAASAVRRFAGYTDSQLRNLRDRLLAQADRSWRAARQPGSDTARHATAAVTAQLLASFAQAETYGLEGNLQAFAPPERGHVAEARRLAGVMFAWLANRSYTNDLAGDRPPPNASVRDLLLLEPGNPARPHKAANSRGRSDDDLITSVFTPNDGQFMAVHRSFPGVILQGNHRRFALIARAEDPESKITWDTPIYIHEG